MTFYWVPIAEAQTPGHEEDSMPLHLIPTPAPQGRLDSLAHLVGRVTWLLVAGVLVAGAGKLLFFPGSARVEPAARTTVAAPPLMPEVLDAALAGALVTCREIAVAEAEQRMAAWHTDLMQRVDDDYLDWYFGYWTQNTLGLKALWHGTLHAVHPASPSAEDRLRQTVRTEFAARVLRPAIAQRELERMTGEVMDVYVAALAQALDAVPETRRIPRGDWNAYLADIGSLVGTTEAARSVDLPAKAMVAASVGGGMVVARAAAPLAARWGAASAGRMAGAGLARGGTQLAAVAGGRFLGPVLGGGILAWDVWDHHRTRATQRPVLRQNLEDYLRELEHVLLYDPEAGVLSVVQDFELSVRMSLPPV